MCQFCVEACERFFFEASEEERQQLVENLIPAKCDDEAAVEAAFNTASEIIAYFPGTFSEKVVLLREGQQALLHKLADEMKMKPQPID